MIQSQFNKKPCRRQFLPMVSLARIAIFSPSNICVMFEPKGVFIEKSRFTAEATVVRLCSVLKSRGAKVYAVIDQQKELSTADIAIPPMHLILFGNPKVGGKVLSEVAVSGIDLPLKILVWEDTAHNISIAYNTAAYLQERFNLKPEVAKLFDLSSVIQSALND
ncbi:DUF302 domain-containing protein [Mucilaginibacter rubeus]|uniref:DUF302 domain-containing protein n=2 Tax=Mucilaginibacter rubeus TaxID=2027860 RepID=A0AAE6MI19_9SPHI|nr:DUF302 domain-containing protein [Mucilaginibacter rubeus]QEM03757.1 DUF302 domain-containing protein [Mucilaginibacter rubeus]QEM16368.1 DUF302 domain-containing protein [Mucilaginibacter gossypii]QTF60437.1 DUF302 domain-containing protein [Mucilaginibacter rubeus]